ncbi:hypothetical protein [Ilumatobacter sp.]|uniref:hypothetical protein n=1 Tax=Ilumatobacter sp. TaxID=1967498 RepID=UPI003C6298DA
MWAGHLNLRAGNHLVAVEYDSTETRDLLRQHCASWLSDDERDVPAAFGVRVVKVGFRRKKVGVLHHGSPIRARFDSVDEAVDAVAGFLREMERLETLMSSRPGQVAVEARAFERGGEVVLFHAPLKIDVDERRLAKIGIHEIQTWKPVIDPADGLVTLGSQSWPLRAVVMGGHGDLELDDARRHVFGLAKPSEMAWAELIDSMGDRVRATTIDVHEALDQALG